ncbi:hypothetical protein OF83DRAFT_1134370 [Amylostereum chailletii]|nr:hypothetical protein OF83DRAFT_1134370 [Amylostereum chailletii]
MPPPLIGTVEESKAQRLERHKARFRERGGVFVPREKNVLLEILLARGVNGDSPTKPQPSGPSPRKAPRKSAASSSKAAKKPKAPRKSTKKSVAAAGEDDDVLPVKKTKGKGKAKVVGGDIVEGPSDPTRSKSKPSKSRKIAKEKAADDVMDDVPKLPKKKAAVKAPRGKSKVKVCEEFEDAEVPEPALSKTSKRKEASSSTSVDSPSDEPSVPTLKLPSSSTAPPSKVPASKRKPSTTSSKPTSASTSVSSHDPASILTARTTPDPIPITKPPRQKFKIRPPAEWDLSTIVESQEEDEDDVPLAQLLATAPPEHPVLPPPLTELTKGKKRVQEVEKPAPNKKRKVKPVIDRDDEPLLQPKCPAKKRAQVASVDEDEPSIPKRKVVNPPTVDVAAKYAEEQDAPVKRKRARVEDDEHATKNDPPPKKRAVKEAAPKLKRSQAKPSDSDLKVEADIDVPLPVPSRHGKENRDTVSRVANEASKVPSIRPIPSPVKPLREAGKLPSKVLKPKGAIPSTKPRSKKVAPPSHRSKPPSRGPPPDVLKRVEACARMQCAPDDEDDEIDFLS